MPAPRGAAAGGVVNGRLCITGGDISNGVNNPVFVYEPIPNRWLMGVAEPTPRALASAAARGGQLFVAGGYPNSIPPATPTAEVFSLARMVSP